MAAAPEPNANRSSHMEAIRGSMLKFVPREPSIVLTQEEAVQFLLRSAAEYEVAFCVNPTCEVCHAFVSTWESVYSGLSPRWREAVDRRLATGEILWPIPPSEEA